MAIVVFRIVCARIVIFACWMEDSNWGSEPFRRDFPKRIFSIYAVLGRFERDQSRSFFVRQAVRDIADRRLRLVTNLGRLVSSVRVLVRGQRQDVSASI